MDHLFGNEAYPIVTSEADIIGAYGLPTTRAVILRDEQAWQQESEVFKSGIIMNSNPELAKLYHSVNGDTNARRYAGDVSYTDVINAQQVFEEAGKAAIDVTPEAAVLFEARMNALRALYGRVHTELYGVHEDESIVGHAMFTPKGGTGRSPMMHVDDVRMTLHTTFSGATLKLLNGMTTDLLWDLMDKTKSNALPPQSRDANDERLTAMTTDYMDEFSSAYLGDVILMKGQKEVDMSDPDTRREMGAHVSSPAISFQGQSAAIFYQKKTLDIE